MGSIKKNIPNALTCMNLVCGFMGINAIWHHQGEKAIYFVLAALIFDFFDGFVARLLKVTSPIGRDLDSLADMITFGVLPGVMMYEMLDFSWQIHQMASPLLPQYLMEYNVIFPLPSLSLFAIVIPVFSAIRLAKFNNDTTQSYNFKGLPTPAVGILVTCLYYYFTAYEPLALLAKNTRMNAYEFLPGDFPVLLKNQILVTLFTQPWILIGITLLLSFLLVSKLPLMAFKFKGFGWKANQWKYIFLFVCIPLIIFLGFASAPIILILYILISQIHFRSEKHEI